MAHNVVEAHEIPAPPSGATSRVSVQVAPSYCQTSPAAPTAIQNEPETHETSFNTESPIVATSQSPS